DTRTSAVREELREQFDGFATWWTQGLGHGNPRLALVAANAAAKYGHVPFPECAHEPALDLAEKLLSTVGEGWAQRVFYSDNGSTAMEVALKIALKSTEKRYGMRISSTTPELEIIGIIGAYHGDTIGVMDACAPSIFNREVTWYRPRGHWFDPPTVLYKFGEYRLSIPPGVQPDKLDLDQESLRFSSLSAVFDLSERLDSPTAKVYRTHVQSALSRLTEKDGRKFGALVIEPVLLGSGGMKLVDPLFQRCLVEEVRNWHWYPDSQRGCGVDEQGTWKGLPVVFDEVFTGLWRLGRKSGADILGVNPDIACYAKLLTGGLLPLSVTLTTEAVFGTFLGETKLQALLHGHSYTAHPTGCAVAAEFLKRMKEMAKVETRSARDEEWSIWSMEVRRSQRGSVLGVGSSKRAVPT
ncbi:MAG: pyridoxal phosphate-dependent transferase, partial [Olpidium bornovanus]